MSSLSTRAMLIHLAISAWSARRYDRAASQEVAANHNADAQRAGRYNKCLIDIKTPTYAAVTNLHGEARRWLEKNTLPWSQDGAFILPTAAYFDVKSKMDDYRERSEHLVEQFLRAYPALVTAAEKDLNGLFKAEDYPSVDDLRRKFGFRWHIFPVPTSNDFRVQLDAGDVDAIRCDIEVEVEKATRDAQRKRWERLLAPVAHAVERLSNAEAKFHDTLIGNIKSAVQLLPKLSVADDDQFDELLREVDVSLANRVPQLLRDNPDERASAAAKARDIERRMRDIMGAFSQ